MFIFFVLFLLDTSHYFWFHIFFLFYSKLILFWLTFYLILIHIWSHLDSHFISSWFISHLILIIIFLLWHVKSKCLSKYLQKKRRSKKCQQKRNSKRWTNIEFICKTENRLRRAKAGSRRSAELAALSFGPSWVNRKNVCQSSQSKD